MKKLRVILYQKPLGITIPKKDIEEMAAFEPHFVAFPEYFFVNPTIGNMNQTPHNQKLQLRRMELLSKGLDCVIIGGTMPELVPEGISNTTYVFDRGENLGFYRKKNLFFAEEGKIVPGKEYRTFTTGNLTFGVLICADVFHDESFLFMEEAGAAIIFSPTFSLKKEESVEDKHQRDREIYVRGASLANAPIVKICGVPSPFKSFLQARSLIASPEEILYRVTPEEETVGLIIKKEIPLE